MLDEELGLEPGPPLRELEQAILRHDAVAPRRDAGPRGSRRAGRSRCCSPAIVGRRPRSGDRRRGAHRRSASPSSGTGARPRRFTGDAAMAVFGAPEDPRGRRASGRPGCADLHAVLPELRIGISHRRGVRRRRGRRSSGDAGTAARAGGRSAARFSSRRRRSLSCATRSGAATSTRGDLAAFVLDELIPGAPGIARRLDRPLIDREAELDELRRAFATARDERRCIVFTGFGDAGIGKTRLARELLAEVADEATVLVGRCVSYGEGATFLPLREMIDGFDELVDVGRLDRRDLPRRATAVRGARGRDGRCCSCSRTSTGPSRRCST